MSFATYISSVYTLLGLASLAATGAFAWWKGGRPERLGTLVLAGTWLGADLVRGLSGEMVPIITLLASDALTSAAFLYIAIRYSSLWLGAAMIFRAIGFALHAAQLSDSEAPRWHGWIIYLLINNILSYLVLLSLAGGTVATILQRRRIAREKADAGARTTARTRPITAPPPPPAAAT
ncbi:MAG: hypothetical protein P4L73_21175 [Caulobacteraceae bacterium]|nr:hypothetical protein [Caulobacteraceae bacterium]